MRRITLQTSWVLALTIVGALAAAPAIAGKPSWAGGSQGEDHGKKAEHGKSGEEPRGEKSEHGKGNAEQHGEKVEYGKGKASERQHARIGDHERTVIHEYYTGRIKGGHCPPGLAKKHNGCLPPGQARKWAIGRPLPRDVVFYSLPPTLVVQLGAPPPQYRYVRVASDILMIAAGTGLVIDAIEDLGVH